MIRLSAASSWVSVKQVARSAPVPEPLHAPPKTSEVTIGSSHAAGILVAAFARALLILSAVFISSVQSVAGGRSPEPTLSEHFSSAFTMLLTTPPAAFAAFF